MHINRLEDDRGDAARRPQIPHSTHSASYDRREETGYSGDSWADARNDNTPISTAELMRRLREEDEN